MSKRIIDLPSGSISDSSLGFIGDPNSGALTETSYRAMKDYFESGSILFLTGSYVTTASFNTFTGSYKNDSASFYNYIGNLVASSSTYAGTSSFNSLSSSYSADSSSFNARINAISASELTGSYVTTFNFNVFSGSVAANFSASNNIISNVVASQSGYLLTSSFIPYSASYVIDSSSWNHNIANIYASESTYTPSSSFNSLSSSYHSDSGSFYTNILNVYASESNYLQTSSINNKNNYHAVFTGSGFTYGSVYQSGSSVLINAVNGVNDSILQAAGNVSIFSTGYLQLPVGNTTQRPPTSSLGATSSIAAFPMVRGNSDTALIEFYNGSQWIPLAASSASFSGSGTVTSVGLTLPASVFGVGNSPIIGAGTLSGSFVTQSINTVFAAPSASNGVPYFRQLVISDIAQLTASFIGQFVLTGSFNQFTSSYYTSSGAFAAQLGNVYSTQSNYVPTASFNAFTASINSYTSSVNVQLSNIYASESGYTPTGSFYNFSGSYYNDSSSNVVKFINIYSSQSNYVPTSSLSGVSFYYPVFSGSYNLVTGSIYTSGSTTLVTSQLTIISGGLGVSGSLADSFGSFGSGGQILSSTGTGVRWSSTGSVGWSLAGNSISSGSFLGTTNAQDLIFKRNNIQVAAFTINNNIVLGNANNSVTGSNAVVIGGTNNFANNMAAVIDGSNNIATGNSSVVVGGQNNVTLGVGSITLGGQNLSASAGYSVALGRFNDPISSSIPSAWIGGDPLLILGNGSSTSSISNALVVYKTGSIAIPYYGSASLNVLSVDVNGYLNNVPFYPSNSINADSASFNARINALTSSVSYLTGSYVTTGSFNSYTASVAIQIANIYASGSDFTTTSSFYAFTSSYRTDSGSNYTKINNIYASESNYLPTSSISGVTNYIPVFTGGLTFGTSSIYKFSGSTLIGSTTGSSNNALLQVFGNIYISQSIYDSSNSTGSINQILTNTSTGIKWISSSSIGVVPQTLSFIIGDGGPYTPLSGSTQFSSSGNPLVGRTLLQFFQEGILMSPISRSVDWYSFTGSQGIINLNNAEFDPDTFYSALYY